MNIAESEATLRKTMNTPNYKIIEWSSIWNFLHKPAHEVWAEASQHVISSSRGVYKWQLFEQYYGGLTSMCAEDLAALRAGPKHDAYWDAAFAATNCIITIGTQRFMAHDGTNGDVFLFPHELPEMWSALNNKDFWEEVEA